MPRHNPDILNEMETRFVAVHIGDATKAAKIAGYKSPGVMGPRLLRRPRVQKALAKKQDSMLKESGKNLGRAVDISRNEVIMIAADIARNKDGVESARVAAATLLAKIFGLIITKTEDVTTKFAGWTEEEMEQYAVTGEYPERIRSLLRSGSVPSSPSEVSGT